MIKSKQKCMILKICSVRAFAVIVSLFVLCNTAVAYASTDDDKMIVVSLGDSYSSGEGIVPFYGQYDAFGQYLAFVDKIKDENWLAHRSTLSWPSLLEIPGIDGTMGDYIRTGSGIDADSDSILYSFGDLYSDSACEWYFAASSGALTTHVMQYSQEEKEEKMGYQEKTYSSYSSLQLFQQETVYLPPQLDVFEEIDEPVDYVTITIGGNDIGFADLITSCVVESTYIELELSNYGERVSSLEHMIEEIWLNFGETKNNIIQVYMDISEAAGSQANIIVVGYPKLFDENIDDNLISAEEAKLINNLVIDFNDEIESIVNDLRETTGMKIYFVDVEQEFEGNEAYSDDPWINEIIFGAQDEDLNQLAITSAYSMHPNKDGAKAYAECVNEMIEEIESADSQVDIYTFADVVQSSATIYSDMLENTSYKQYAFYDIDKDGIEELLLSDGVTGGFGELQVYTYDGVDVIDLGICYTQYGIYEYEGNGIIFSGGGTGVLTHEISSIWNRQLLQNETLYLNMSSVPEEFGGDTYEYNGSSVSEEVYNEYKSELIEIAFEDILNENSESYTLSDVSGIWEMDTNLCNEKNGNYIKDVFGSSYTYTNILQIDDEGGFSCCFSFMYGVGACEVSDDKISYEASGDEYWIPAGDISIEYINGEVYLAMPISVGEDYTIYWAKQQGSNQ